MIWRTPRFSLHPSEVLELHPIQWLHQYISYLFLRCNILELHYSLLHHIPDIVILDLNMLRLIMEHQVLQQLHATPVVAKIQVASISRSNKLDSSFLSHNSSQLAKEVVTYSALVVLNAMQDYFLVNQEITRDPILK